jgi:hypothetical protein
MLQYNINPKHIYSLKQVSGVDNLIQEKSYVSMLKIDLVNFLMTT